MRADHAVTGPPPTAAEVLAQLARTDVPPALSRSEVAWLVQGARALRGGRLARRNDPQVSPLSTGQLLRELEGKGVVRGARGPAARRFGRTSGLSPSGYYYALPSRDPDSDPSEEAFRRAWSLLERALEGRVTSVYGTASKRLVVELDQTQALRLVAELATVDTEDRR